MPRKKRGAGGVIPPEGAADYMTEGVPGGPPPPEPEEPAPARVPAKKKRQKAPEEEVRHLTSLVDAVPLTLMLVLGPEAAFTPLEQMLIKESANRYIAELDRRTVEALNTWVPVVSFLAGSVMYTLRIAQLWERKQKEHELREAQRRAAEDAARRKAMGMMREPERSAAEQAEEKPAEETPPVMPPPPEITQHFAPR